MVEVLTITRLRRLFDTCFEAIFEARVRRAAMRRQMAQSVISAGAPVPRKLMTLTTVIGGLQAGATSGAHSQGGVQATPQREVCLRVQVDTLHGETVFVCGSSPEMGEWQVAGALAMHPEDPATKVWAVRVQVPLQRTVEFRYLVGILLDSGEIIVRRWETVVHPRSIGANELTMDRNAAIDIFGSYDGEERMEPGWLTSESVVQLKMFNSPVVLWKRKYQSLPLSYKVTPIDLAASTADAPAVVEESDQHSNVSDFECVKWPVIEIA
ncbi:hypothetical protein HPB47_013735, partial [Ixodes persulcatus]